MYTFLVLGIIPGTNIQISFQAWLVAASSALAIALMMRALWQVNAGWIANMQPVRQPVHANQLHRRIG